MSIAPTYNEIMGMGFSIGSDVRQQTVELAIEAATLYYVEPSMETTEFDALDNLAATSTLVKGGTYDKDGKTYHVAGLKKGLAYIAYAELLRMNVNATTFGSVQKEDEYSKNVDPSEQIKYFLAVGLRYVRQVVELLGYKWAAKTGVGRETYYTERRTREWV